MKNLARWFNVQMQREDVRSVKIVSKEYDEQTNEFIGYRDTTIDDDLWFACVELNNQRCPFPFALDLQDDDEDNIPDWLTDDVKKQARLFGWSICLFF